MQKLTYNILEYSNWDDLRAIMDSFTGPVALDTETTSLRWFVAECEGVSLAHDADVVWIPSDSPVWPHFIKYMRTWIPTVKEIIMHNAPFDMKILYKYGVVDFRNIFCTMTAAHLLNEEGSSKLKDIAQDLLNIRVQYYQDVQFLPRTDINFIRYACEDAVMTLKLYEIFKKAIEVQNLHNLFYKIEMPLQLVLRDMEVRGIEADSELAKSYLCKLEDILLQLQIKLHTSAGLRYNLQCDLLGNKFVTSKWNFNSNQQLVTIITEILKLKVPYETDNGNPSVGKKTRKALKDRSDFIRYLDIYSSASKIYSNFIVPFEKFVDGDGRIRTSFNNTVAVTGRITSSEPNNQNLAKENEEIGISVRKCYTTKPGYKMIAGDFAGQELRVLAEVSGDPVLVDAIHKGQDLHLTVANKIFNLGIAEEHLRVTSPSYNEFKEKYAKERHIAKNGVLFPLIYGSTAHGISASLGCTEAEAQRYIDSFFESFPKVKQIIDKCHQLMYRYDYVCTKAGRRRRFRKIMGKHTSRSARQAFNFWIQGTSADMMKATLVKLHGELSKNPQWDAHIILQVYDEVVVECREEFAEDCAKLIEQCMLTAFPLNRVPLECEVKIGDNYAEVK